MAETVQESRNESEPMPISKETILAGTDSSCYESGGKTGGIKKDGMIQRIECPGEGFECHLQKVLEMPVWNGECVMSGRSAWWLGVR